MKTQNYIKTMGATVLLTLLVACSSPDRSRNLNDASVSAHSIATQVCLNCHGVSGVSISPNFPNLAAQTPDYLEKQLKEFRSPGRSDPQGYEYMWGLSANLTDEQIRGLAEHFSKLPAAKGNHSSEATPAMLARGKSIFDQGIPNDGVPACSSCHGEQAHGAGPFPRLAGQKVPYLIKQLEVFKLTDQRPAGVMMKAVTHNISNQDMTSVASYLETLN